MCQKCKNLFGCHVHMCPSGGGPRLNIRMPGVRQPNSCSTELQLGKPAYSREAEATAPEFRPALSVRQ